MESKLSFNKFEETITRNTLPGNPSIMGSPFAIFNIFDNKEKYFYGEHIKNRFRITRNAGLLNLCEFTINGTYANSQDEKRTTLEYTVEPILFGYWCIRLVPAIALIALNIFLLVNISEDRLSIFLTLNLWIGIPWLLILWLSKIKKKWMTNKFIETFAVIE